VSSEEKKEHSIEIKPLDISFLDDVKLKIRVSVGSTKKMLLEIVSLKEGNIIELDTTLDDYINVYVNTQKFALGEMVVANDKYGVRIVDLA